jgi:hypothetical protein
MTRNLSKCDNNVNGKLSGWDKDIADTKKGIARLQAALDHSGNEKGAGTVAGIKRGNSKAIGLDTLARKSRKCSS